MALHWADVAYSLCLPSEWPITRAYEFRDGTIYWELRYLYHIVSGHYCRDYKIRKWVVPWARALGGEAIRRGSSDSGCINFDLASTFHVLRLLMCGLRQRQGPATLRKCYLDVLTAFSAKARRVGRPLPMHCVRGSLGLTGGPWVTQRTPVLARP